MSVRILSDKLELDDELLSSSSSSSSSSSCCTSSNTATNAADATDVAAPDQPVPTHSSRAMRVVGRAAGGAAVIAVAGCAAAVVCAKLLRRRRTRRAAPIAAPPPSASASTTAGDHSFLLCQRLASCRATSHSPASSGCSSSGTLTTDTSPDITATSSETCRDDISMTATSIEASSDDISITALLDLSTSIAADAATPAGPKAAAGLKAPDSCSSDTGRSKAPDAASDCDLPTAPCSTDTAPLPRGEWAPRGSELYARLESRLWHDADQVFAAGAPLGAGGQGEVRRVALLGRSYALKCDTDGDSEEGTFERQLSSAAARALVVSPIVSACGKNCVATYHLFELAAGDLDNVVAGLRYSTGRARLSPDQLAPVLRQMAEALGAMHSVGLAHNDVKPANFLLGYDGRLKIGDLGLTDKAFTPPCGLSKMYAAPEVAVLMRLAREGGTAEAACEGLRPERPPRRPLRMRFGWLRRRRASAPAAAPSVSDWRRADVYSLGMSALQLFLGAKLDAFVATNSLLEGGAAFVAPEGMPADLSALLGGMLACDPRARPMTDAVVRHPFFERCNSASARALDLLALAERGRAGARAGA